MLVRHCHLLTTYVNISILFSNLHGQIFNRNIHVTTLLKVCVIELDLNTDDISYKCTKILRCWVRLYLQLFVGGLMSYLRYLCLLGSSLPPVVWRKAHVLFTLFVFVFVEWYPFHIVLCFCFILCCGLLLTM